MTTEHSWQQRGISSEQRTIKILSTPSRLLICHTSQSGTHSLTHNYRTPNTRVIYMLLYATKKYIHYNYQSIYMYIQVSPPGLHISLGVFYCLFTLLETECHQLPPTQSGIPVVGAGPSFEDHVAMVCEQQSLMEHIKTLETTTLKCYGKRHYENERTNRVQYI